MTTKTVFGIALKRRLCVLEEIIQSGNNVSQTIRKNDYLHFLLRKYFNGFF